MPTTMTMPLLPSTLVLVHEVLPRPSVHHATNVPHTILYVFRGCCSAVQHKRLQRQTNSLVLSLFLCSPHVPGADEGADEDPQEDGHPSWYGFAYHPSTVP
jgi:hypothetical protein